MFSYDKIVCQSNIFYFTNMSETSNFELLMKLSSNKKPNTLYSGCKLQNKDNITPKEVLSSVYSQIRTIQGADLKHIKSNKRNELKNCSSKYLSVNNVPVYREVPSTSSKFDTQCVSDTQLIDLIENAENEQNKCITEEFETSFHNTEHTTEINKALDASNTGTITKPIEKDKNTHIVMIEGDKDNSGTITNRAKERDKVTTISMIEVEKHTETGNSVTKFKAIDKNIPISVIERDRDTDSIRTLEQYSENLFDDTIVEIQDIKSIENVDIVIEDNSIIEKEIDYSKDEYSPILNQCKKDETIIERPISPIFLHKNTKSKSNTPSPRVFDLDTFEQFENMVIPLLENNDFDVAKTIINSQIMGGELLLNINEKVTLNVNKATVNSVVDKDINMVPLHDGNPTVDKNLEIKENFDKVTNKDTKVDPSQILEDEILFSSDEESNIDINYKDLPFTCALETGFDQSDILDKTVYVGFQTASNRSILVGKESFDKAKSLLDVEGISITEMVNNCDSIKKDKNQNSKDDFENKSIKNSGLMLDSKDTKKDTQPKITSFQGLVTANKKKITLSETALARCKKVFQDIDLTENFDTIADNNNQYKIMCDKPDKEPVKMDTVVTEKLKHNTKKETTNTTEHITISDTQIVLDDAMIKELEDIEMSLQDNHVNPTKIREDKSIVDEKTSRANKMDVKLLRENYNELENFKGFKTASNTIIKISKEALEKTKNVFQDVDHSDIFYKSSQELKDENLYKPSTGTTFDDFKTASNRAINVSNNALSKVKHIFKDIDVEELPSKNKESVKPYPTDDYQELGAIGFKTASNKNINISKQALQKTTNIFKDIDDIPKEMEKEEVLEYINKNCSNKKPYPDISESVYNVNLTTDKDKGNVSTRQEIIPLNATKNSNNAKPENRSFIKSAFMGFQTANNKTIGVSFEALEKTKYIFKDIDSTQREIVENKTKDEKLNPQPSTSKVFPGFLTANNKPIGVTEESLTQTKMLFEDIDALDKEKTKKTENIGSSNEEPKVIKEYRRKPFVGFKTANNTKITISKEALAKSKNVFKDIECDLQIPKMNTFKAIESISKPIGACITTSKTAFAGFKTANDKEIKISDAALAKTKAIFQEMDGTDFVIPMNKKQDYPDIEDKNIEKIDENPETQTNNGLSTKNTTFQGFETASNKNVKVSAETLAKTKDIFKYVDKFEDFVGKNLKDINIEPLNDGECISENVFKKTSPVFKGFATANNKKVNISEECLAKAKKLFEDFDNTGTFTNKDDNQTRNTTTDICKTKRLFSEVDNQKPDSINKKGKNETSKEAIENIIDTQVLNDFEESLHTDDFKETPKPPKRSLSPILSCPKAKKRKKFEIPYSQNKIVQPIPKTEEYIKTTNIFDDNYKKHKKYTLKDVQKMAIGINTATDDYIDKFNFDSLLNFEFTGDRNNFNTSAKTVNDVKEIFLNNVNKKLIPNGWIENHLQLILWKVISYERFFKNLIKCDVKTILDQLKFRYDVELYHAKRPALRKILEKDDVPCKTIVLCVVRVNDVITSTTNTNIELLLTDGWYTIRTVIDKMLAELVVNGRISVGTKLVTNGAELLNCEQGISPWEDTSTVRLKIFGNSTRRARWDARLGYHGNAAILSRLSDVKLSGGKVSKLRVYVTRVYPALYVDKFEDGSTVTRSERLELLHQAKLETDRQVMMEKIYEEVEKEFAELGSQDSEGISGPSSKRTCMDSGSQISKFIKRSKDPGEAKCHLTSSQTKLLDDYTARKLNILLEDIQNRVREKIGEVRQRNVVMLVKMRVADVKSGEVVKGMLSLWKPTDAVLELIKEGAWIDIINVTPTALRYSEIQLSAGRQTIFNFSKYKTPEKIKPHIELLKRKCYTVKDLASNPLMCTDYNEIDTAGIVFLIDPSLSQFDSKKQQFQNVFLADSDKKIISINFWGGLTKFGYENVLDTGQVVFCGNLQKRVGNTRKNIPQYRATELSYFTKTPKNENARSLIEDLNKKFLSLDRRKFCDECIALMNSYFTLKYSENISPYRFNTSDINSSKNRVFIDSPLASKTDDNFNLTGLDFESTFRQIDTQYSKEVIQRKKKVNEKIAKLKMYGEPPPLCPLNIINMSKNATSSYKSPLLDKNSSTSKVDELNSMQTKYDSCINIASVKKTPRNSGNFDVVQSSDILNKTYVKSINPVKINFDVKDNNESSFDHFAEDFDGSPPLSLD